MLVLRPYQESALSAILEALDERQAALCVAPTGSGKTEIMTALIQCHPTDKIIVVIKRVNLVEQTARRFEEAGIKTEVFCSTLKKRGLGRVTVTSIDSFHSVKEYVKASIVILDEVHNLDEANTRARYSQTVNWFKSQGSKFVGFTATPFRSKGYIYGEEKLFTQIDYDIKITTLIEMGYLVKPIMKATSNILDVSHISTVMGDWSQSELDELVSDDEKLDLQVAEALKKLEGRKKIFWQATNCSHAERIHARLTDASLVHTKDMNFNERNLELEAFEKGSNRHCVFVSILSEGYNYPPADALVLLRPTKSPVLYVQTVGRVLRTYQGKQDALILDFGLVRETCGPLDNPNIKVSRGNQSIIKPAFWVCVSCMTYNNLDILECADCGAVKPQASEAKSAEARTSIVATESELLSAWEKPDVKLTSVDTVTAEPYKSKAGNKCVLISYVVSDGTLWGHKTLREYFPLDHKWAQQRFLKRSTQLGLPRVVEKKVFASVVPRKIEYWYEGDYPKFGELIL